MKVYPHLISGRMMNDDGIALVLSLSLLYNNAGWDLDVTQTKETKTFSQLLRVFLK